eukprot:CAMPEP_0203811690 /NCGR_PEP_ID=MMETSP0115-20131106/3711_1 /ASSEMBLY_ACC=CAM_ASM_000227 /TAXON_ID=33651 /ORGANISM="Bicosoecid sp, Strain ms1" /LENGTH=489 /DNA_ID=CAMNT_0050720521 /DNA_START=138 /DNA_END=1604 /DNA_ORIENTATION=+
MAGVRAALWLVGAVFIAAAASHVQAACPANEGPGDGYFMYVWDDAFFNNGDCPGADPANWGNEADCFEQAWSSQSLRSKLWASVRTDVPAERRVSRIALSKIKDIVAGSAAGSASCATAAAANLKATLREAHDASVDVEVYALLATSDAAFSEKDHALMVVAWNEHCADTAAEQFDGIAINNEHFSSIKCVSGAEADMVTFLDDMAEAKANAGTLPVHMSLGWHWGWCSVSGGVPNDIEWGGVTKKATEHMIDILDSFDVQVAWNTAATMADRAHDAGYQYFVDNYSGSKQFYVLAYLNEVDDCRQSFFPVDSCATGDLTEQGVWDAFDDMVDAAAVTSAVAVPLARGGLHYYRGVYSTGFPGWPEHDAAPVIPCVPCADNVACADSGYCQADGTCAESCEVASGVQGCGTCEIAAGADACQACAAGSDEILDYYKRDGTTEKRCCMADGADASRCACGSDETRISNGHCLSCDGDKVVDASGACACPE